MAFKKFLKFLLVLLIIFACIAAILIYATRPKNNPANYQTEVYFSPLGHIRDRIIKEIDNAKTSIDLAIFDFTSQDIKETFERAKQRGVAVRITADFRQAQGAHSVVQQLVEEGFNVKVARGKSRGIMHNKFAIFDGKLLLTGSYNWTKNAEEFNYENAVFITDPKIINQYQKEFEIIWEASFTPAF